MNFTNDYLQYSIYLIQKLQPQSKVNFNTNLTTQILSQNRWSKVYPNGLKRGSASHSFARNEQKY